MLGEDRPECALLVYQILKKSIVLSWLKVTDLNWCEAEEKCEENWAIFKNLYLANYYFNFL